MIRLILLAVCISGTLSGVTTSVRQILSSFHGDSQCFGILCGVPPDVEEDANLLVPGLLTKYGYPVEVHSVTTEDGYILEVHRIPNPGAQPVFLQHGLLDSSATWIIMGPNQGLAYLLHDMGYDVWMGNSRGNRYSKRHRTLNVDSRDFWDFSFHELGIHDLPTMIDHILNQTNHAKLHYIGHSQGTAAFWVMTSERPQYNEKILSMHALAPVAYLEHVRSPFIKFMVKLLSGVHAFTKIFGIKQFLPSSWLLSEGGKVLCEERSLLEPMCSNILFVISGHNSLQLNRTMLPVLLAHTPAGASVKQMVHLGQLAKFGRFQYYDAGVLSNIDKYSWITPPEYNLKKVTAPVFLYYSKNDWLIGVQDAEKLWGNLPNVYARFLIEETRFNHLDFVWAIDARPLLYNRLAQMLQYMDKEKHAKIDDRTKNFDDNNNLNFFTLKTY